MARRWQRERTIQHAAVAWLAQRFADQNPRARVCFQEEAHVRRSVRFWGRADGLIAVRFRDGETHTIALEAKSMRTREAMRGELGCGPLAAGGLLPGGAVGAIVGWELVPRLGACAGGALALLAALAGGLLLLSGLDAAQRLEDHAAVGQLMRYPAGERWLVLPADYLRRHEHRFPSLKAACERRGIGLLTVDRRLNVMVEWEAAGDRRKDLLSKYKGGDELRNAVDLAVPGTAVPFKKPGKQ